MIIQFYGALNKLHMMVVMIVRLIMCHTVVVVTRLYGFQWFVKVKNRKYFERGFTVACIYMVLLTNPQVTVVQLNSLVIMM